MKIERDTTARSFGRSPLVLLLTAILLGNGCRKPQKIATPILEKTSSKEKECSAEAPKANQYREKTSSKEKECSAEAPKANQYREKTKTLSPLEKLIVKTEQERAAKEAERAEKEQAQARIVELKAQLATRRIALNLLSTNMPIALISSATGLSIEEVEDLR